MFVPTVLVSIFSLLVYFLMFMLILWLAPPQDAKNYVYFLTSDELYQCGQILEYGCQKDELTAFLISIKERIQVREWNDRRLYSFSESTKKRFLNAFYSIVDKELALRLSQPSLMDAIYFYTRAVKKEPPSLLAIIRLSEMCRIGIGVQKSEQLAKNLFEKGLNLIKSAAENGDREMMKHLANYYRTQGETEAANYWFQRSNS